MADGESLGPESQAVPMTRREALAAGAAVGAGAAAYGALAAELAHAQTASAATHMLPPSAQVFPFDADVTWPREIDGRPMDTYHRWMEVVTPATLSGCPVINVPVGFDRRGRPMGMQVIGRMHAERSLLQLAYAYEQETEWVRRRIPPLLSEVYGPGS